MQHRIFLLFVALLLLVLTGCGMADNKTAVATQLNAANAKAEAAETKLAVSETKLANTETKLANTETKLTVSETNLLLANGELEANTARIAELETVLDTATHKAAIASAAADSSWPAIKHYGIVALFVFALYVLGFRTRYVGVHPRAIKLVRHLCAGRAGQAQTVQNPSGSPVPAPIL